ncbi:MAG: hypothetical protein A2511_07550 [Deltaproteobacteria bacterium RIFOXYD12_FULL_50_9]|nr:MAG: hypothetical protein A2511_07550 [Deltaproteobacteria bacterium RIFOXYD12_FULL_50_9]
MTGRKSKGQKPYTFGNKLLLNQWHVCLFGIDPLSVSAINQHLQHIFADNELEEVAVIKQYLITADGKKYQFYPRAQEGQ